MMILEVFNVSHFNVRWYEAVLFVCKLIGFMKIKIFCF
jgi:hypothetical protein